MARDRIGLRGLKFYGFHGVLNEENSLGQIFIVDIDLFADLSIAGRSDQVEDTISYAEVYTRIKTIVKKERYQLIEKLAERIAEVVLAEFACEGVSVTVHKPQAPMQGIFDDAFVEIYREKKL
ncbi:MAG: dihydroneopterin aldolase [Desulfitobacterium sp.]